MPPNPKGNRNNLDPVKTKEEAKLRGRNGGIKSGQVKREKKLMSEILLRYLGYKDEKDFYASLDGVLENKDSSSVNAMKMLLELEASKISVNIDGDKELLAKLLGDKD